MTSLERKHLKFLKDFVRSKARLANSKKDNAADFKESESGEIDLLRHSYANLKPLYDSEVKGLRSRIKDILVNHSNLFAPTAFEVMDRHAIEASHSNVLAYLFEADTQKMFLRVILDKVGTKEAQSALGELGGGRYKVIREYVIKGKRIDIVVELQNHLVLIENKFHARLHMVDDELTQTDFYFHEMRKKCPEKTLVCIIIDYKDRETNKHWTTLNYSTLFTCLDSTRTAFGENSVFNEYHRLLRRLSFRLHEVDMFNKSTRAYLSVLRDTISGVSKWKLEKN